MTRHDTTRLDSNFESESEADSESDSDSDPPSVSIAVGCSVVWVHDEPDSLRLMGRARIRQKADRQARLLDERRIPDACRYRRGLRHQLHFGVVEVNSGRDRALRRRGSGGGRAV